MSFTDIFSSWESIVMLVGIAICWYFLFYVCIIYSNKIDKVSESDDE